MRAADKKDIIGAFPSCAGAADKYGGNRDERSSVGRRLIIGVKIREFSLMLCGADFSQAKKRSPPTKTRATATRSFAAPHGQNREENTL